MYKGGRVEKEAKRRTRARHSIPMFERASSALFFFQFNSMIDYEHLSSSFPCPADLDTFPMEKETSHYDIELQLHSLSYA